MAENSVTDNVFFPEDTLVAVQTAQPPDRTFDYKAPADGCALGAFVEVPLGPRKVPGVVWGPGAGNFGGRMRSVIGVLDIPPMRMEMMDFLARTSAYTLTPMNAMLRLATRAPGLTDTPGMRRIYGHGGGRPDRMTAARAKVIAVLEDQEGQRFTLSELSSLAGVTSSVVKGLLKQRVLVGYDMPQDTAYPRLDPERPGKPLTAEQLAVAKALRARVGTRTYGTVLLKGVTGSGKTEVYLEAVAATLAAGRQVLVLLPEIALTAAFLDRVKARFGAHPAEWHSGVTQTERRRCFRMVAAGKAQLVVGARSALFLPYADLGLVVVDEEHDGSYKQEDGVFYNARDLAVLRASRCDATVVLASATPSLETWENAQSGKYTHHGLKNRFGAAALPDMQAIDLRADRPGPGQWISGILAREVLGRLDRKEQSLLFLNRRGYAPLTVCRACGMQIGCDHCDARMVEHRFHGHLMCHQCGATRPMPEACPACGQEDRLAAVGPGIERLAEEAAARFGGARIALLSSDMMLSARGLKKRIQEIADGGADIIIGTQMVAKGHNFPQLTLVGVIDADLGLQGGDLRAAERTFQLIRQVAGRAGRADKKGVAYVQTHQPGHPVIQAILSGDEDAFWTVEATQRKAAGMPPYGRLAGVILSGPDIGQVHDVAGALARAAGRLRRVGAEIYGPAPAPIARIRGRYRVRMLVKAAKSVPLQAALAQWAGQVKLPSQVRLAIDIDPQTFF